MIISHEYRFIFLKTYKTGSTSLELALSQVCGENAVVTPVSDEDERLREGHRPRNFKRPSDDALPGARPDRAIDFYNHIPAAKVRAYIGESIWRSYFKFAFERNPWDRQVSLFYFRHARLGMTFEEHLAQRGSRLPNFDIYSTNGSIDIDFVGRYETLENDFRAALAAIGIRRGIALPHAKSGIRPSGDDYRRHYTGTTLALIDRWYRREITMLGYQF